MNNITRLFTGDDHAASLVEGMGAILTGHFEIGYLHHSLYFIDKPALLCHPKTTEMLCKLLVEYLIKRKDIEVVVAPPSFGLHVAFPMALVLNANVVQIDGDQKGYSIRPSAQALIANRNVLVADCISVSGRTLNDISSLVKRLGGNVVERAVLIDRGISHPAYAGTSRPTSLLQANMPITTPEECPTCIAGTTYPGPTPTHELFTARELSRTASR